jgi:hypothetical protein
VQEEGEVDRSEVGEEAHGEHREAAVASVLVGEGVEAVAVSPGAVVVASLPEEEGPRGGGSHGDVADHLYPVVMACLCR